MSVPTWDEYYLELAKTVSLKSKDPSTKCGAVIVKNGAVVGCGFNGFARGIKDTEERWNDREQKYKLVVHCEENAIINAARSGHPTLGATMYLTGDSCGNCASRVVNAGIVRVVWPENNSFVTRVDWKKSCNLARDIYSEGGVRIDVVEYDS